MPTLALWDIDDAQRFCRAIVSRSRLSLTPDDREDLEAYLVAECWNLSRKYDPAEAASPHSPAAHSDSRSSTGNGNATAAPPGEAEAAPTSGLGLRSFRSTPSTISLVPNWAGLSPEGAWVTTRIGWPLSCGASTREVAGHLAVTVGWVESQLERLRAELVQLAD